MLLAPLHQISAEVSITTCLQQFKLADCQDSRLQESGLCFGYYFEMLKHQENNLEAKNFHILFDKKTTIKQMSISPVTECSWSLYSYMHKIYFLDIFLTVKNIQGAFQRHSWTCLLCQQSISVKANAKVSISFYY